MNRDAESFVYCLFTLGKDEEEAHAHLKQNLPAGQEVDIGQIIDFYSRIRIGEFQFNAEKHVSERIAEEGQEQHLMKLPEEVKRHVISLLDAGGRATLRRVSPFFRALVDECPVRTNELIITIGRRSFTVNDRINNIHLDYERINHGALLHRGPNSPVVRPGDYKAIIKTDLIEILGNPRLRIGTLVIKDQDLGILETHRRVYSDLVDAIHQALVHNLHRGKRLKVDKLVMNIAEISNFYHILTFLDAAYLRQIQLGDQELTDIFRHIARFWQLPQWQNTRIFRSPLRIRDPNFVRNFSHFDSAEVRLAGETFSFERIWQLARIYLTRPSFIQMRIDLWRFKKQEFDVYMMGKQDATRERNGWSFRYRGSQNKLLLECTNDVIWFKGPEYREGAEPRPLPPVPRRRDDGLDVRLEQLLNEEAAANARAGRVGGLMEALRRGMGLG
ncbi:hypothetical protein CAEBREN_00589 [Caenorhabditis brenneri]|uniref:F-box domain-containing protein n=1 Tax=Caenorhabditis brenneri TaxID=135651 RepID=G0N2Q3_CAEBE|nr:hypothetical protein CAEBREN_00589 [Caenorhabditis brenneri]